MTMGCSLLDAAMLLFCSCRGIAVAADPAVSSSRGSATAVPAAKPNVLLLLVDDMGYNDVEYHNLGQGPGWTKTPNMDRLSMRGVKLEHHYANPICSPTRATIQTGRYTIRTGIQHSCYGAGTGVGLPLSERTIAQSLKAAGYETWAFGKWHLGFNTKAFIPTSRGYDYHYGHYQAAVEAYNHTAGASGTASPRNGLDWHRNGAAVDGVGVSGTHTCQLLTADLVQKLHSRARTPGALPAVPPPLFVYMAWHMIHEGDGTPNPPASVSSGKGKDATKLVEAPPCYSAPYAHNESDLSRRVFLGMVSLVDEAVGNATAAWEAAGYATNGVVIVSSDNGSPPDQRGLSGNLPFRGFKHQLWEGGLRVPTFVFGTGVPTGGIQRTAVTAQIDLFPTIVTLAGGDLKAGPPLDGLDLWWVSVSG
jgi:arylsulfatase A-like enzyme